MTRRAQDEYAEALHARYRAVSKEHKGRILDEYCRTTGCHRKAAHRRPTLLGPHVQLRTGSRAPAFSTSCGTQPAARLWPTSQPGAPTIQRWPHQLVRSVFLSKARQAVDPAWSEPSFTAHKKDLTGYSTSVIFLLWNWKLNTLTSLSTGGIP